MGWKRVKAKEGPLKQSELVASYVAFDQGIFETPRSLLCQD
jgi:hypothetical protein